MWASSKNEEMHGVLIGAIARGLREYGSLYLEKPHRIMPVISTEGETIVEVVLAGGMKFEVHVEEVRGELVE